ncbi:hypothetical protein PMG71_20910 [Roseofilum sp. BLCC_M154]|uniref:Outer membrane protein beta-barrel domain-containing protein n=1 Tax=Roseofilum acuticapitatum BLCC-M154 TaxID=3022444 RepID=A0ABT7AYB2_9CYAN|nr:hypothetical protein [Roseofilum acuticapitatum]MDJ1171894.1 hypothetical protein [Roseofilum acuticapitatum BLCC-M154]
MTLIITVLRRINLYLFLNLAAIVAIAPQSASAQTSGYAPLEAPYLAPEIPVTPTAISPEAFEATLDTVRTQTLPSAPVTAPQQIKATSDYEIPGQGSANAQELGETPVSGAFAQAPEGQNSYSVERRRYERSQYYNGFSYIGLGATIGLHGESSMGNVGGTILSRVAFTENFSFRPSVIIGDGTSITIPFTYDIPFSREPYGPPVTLFLGGGFGLDLKNGTHGPLITTGIDIPFSKNFTFNATLNTGFWDVRALDWGLTLGVGYNFPGLFDR